MCGNVVNDVQPADFFSKMADVVKDKGIWDLGDITLSRDAAVCPGLWVEIAAIQLQCSELSILCPEKSCADFKLSSGWRIEARGWNKGASRSIVHNGNEASSKIRVVKDSGSEKPMRNAT